LRIRLIFSSSVTSLMLSENAFNTKSKTFKETHNLKSG
jgi:hypothetical protein